ncbi:hypothetical protein FTO74_12805 [Granulicella sp. WH15]|uniref:hypothetical protein n=1 Tax=Granulicella sp. WH15 TaxID=2602070 RepID=UPI001366F5BB|nr:hypothetical protein [Granulicella sp. WH15]QHN04149.1 hypothetical protein FTO74_12805 [Granulicella sp. WH15]
MPNGSALEEQRDAARSAHWFRDAGSTRQLIVWRIVLVLICTHFALDYDAHRDYLNLSTYMQGLAKTPFQYRVLPMYILRIFANLPATARIATHLPPLLHDPRQLVQTGIVLFSMLGAVLATFHTLVLLTADREFSRWFSLLVVYMAYFNLAPGWGLDYTLPYDTPSLFFFCLGVYFVVSQRTWAFYLLLPFAALNRETSCFLTLFFLIWSWCKSSRQRPTQRQLAILSAHALVQLFIWGAIKAWLSHRYAANPSEGALGSSTILFRLRYNLPELAKPQQWPVLLSTFGFTLPALWAGRHWIRNKGITWTCAILIPAWFAGMMMVGVITEIRIFSELTAFIVPALALIVHNRFRPVESIEH